MACVTIVSLADARCSTTVGIERLARPVSQRVGDIANPETEQLGGLGSHARDACGPSDLIASQ